MIRLGRTKEVNRLVRKFHYSHRPAPEGFVVLTVSYHNEGEGLFGDEGPVQSGVIFCIPPTRWAEPVLELIRMVRREDYAGPPLSKLVSVGTREIKRTGEWDLIVSFADPVHGHHGGIYQSCSWNYAGRRKRTRDGFQIGNRFVPSRTCYQIYKTQSLPKLQHRFRDRNVQVTPHFDEGKHLYWKPLNKRGKRKAERLGLDILPYPKPDREET